MRILLALIVVLTLSAVGWLASGPGPESGASPVDGPAPTSPVAPAPLVAGEARGAPPGVTAGSDADPGSDAPTRSAPVGERRAARSAEELEADEDGEPLVVRVHDEAGVPLAGLEVVLLDRDRYDRGAFDEAQDRARDDRERAALLRRFGQVVRTDEGGRAAFVWGGRPSRVWVLADWGLEETRLTRRQLTDGVLAIEVGVPPLAVRVFGPDARPLAGVVVHARHPLGLMRAEGVRDEFDLAAAVTDADGWAYPREWEVVRTIGGTRPLGELGIELVVHALVREGMVRAVDREPVASDPFRFDLPPTAPLEVLLAGADGAPVTDERLRVRIEFADVGERALELGRYPTAATSEAPFWTCLARDGVARLEHVELGHPLRVEVESLDREWRAELELPALLEAGVTRRVELAVDRERRLALRAVDPSGEPLWPERLALRFDDADGALLFEREVRTERDGRVEVLLDEADLSGDAPPSPATVVVRADVDGERYGAVHRFERPPGPGTTELGDLVLAPLPRVAAGVVLDPAGEPVRGAHVAVLEPLPDGVGGTAHELHALQSLGYGGSSAAPPAAGWRERAPELRDETYRDGRFSLRETGVEGPVALRVWTDRGELFQTAVLPVPLGAEDLVITLVPGGSIAVHLRHDEVEAVEDLVQVVLRTPTGERFYGRAGENPMDWNDLRPGSHDVLVLRSTDSATLAEVQGVVVPSGGAASDGRIDPLDLTPHTRVVRLRVEDGDGRGVESWAFHASGSTRVAAVGPQRTRTDGGPQDLSGLLLLPRGGAADGYVTAPGFRPALVRGLEDGAVVRLERGLELEFVLAGLDPALDPRRVACFLTYDLSAVDAPDDLDRARAGRVSLRFDAAGRTSATLPAPGPYRARFSADERGTGLFANDRQIEIQVRETDTTIMLAVPDALRAGG